MVMHLLIRLYMQGGKASMKSVKNEHTYPLEGLARVSELKGAASPHLPEVAGEGKYEQRWKEA